MVVVVVVFVVGPVVARIVVIAGNRFAYGSSPCERRQRGQGWGWNGMNALTRVLLSSTTTTASSSNVSASPSKFGDRAGKTSEIFHVGILRHIAG